MSTQLIGGDWPSSWKPRGFGTLHHEPFSQWWERHGSTFQRFDPRVLEQFVHRHWSYSEYFGFPLLSYNCTLERLSTDVFLSNIGTTLHRRFSENLDLKHLADMFDHLYKNGYEPAKTMKQTGTWDMPVLLVRDESGFLHRDHDFRDYPLWLLEGHQRFRCLHVLAHRNECASDHEALVLTRMI